MVKNYIKYLDNSDIKRNIILSLIILIIVLITIIAITMFYFPKSCETLQCFTNSLENCERASLVRVDSSAAWYYEIIKKDSDESCKVKVTLLKMKEGKTDIETLEGLEMICIVKKGETLFPEENIDTCSGLLKEQLQGIIIEKMHSYIIKNIGDIKNKFNV